MQISEKSVRMLAAAIIFSAVILASALVFASLRMNPDALSIVPVAHAQTASAYPRVNVDYRNYNDVNQGFIFTGKHGKAAAISVSHDSGGSVTGIFVVYEDGFVVFCPAPFGQKTTASGFGSLMR
jgi:hypothetical protein